MIKVQYYIDIVTSDRCTSNCENYSNIRFNTIKEIETFLKEKNIELHKLNDNYDYYTLRMTYKYNDFKCLDYKE